MRSRRVGNPSNGTRAGINVSTDTLPPGCKHVDENPKGSCKNLEKGAAARSLWLRPSRRWKKPSSRPAAYGPEPRPPRRRRA